MAREIRLPKEILSWRENQGMYSRGLIAHVHKFDNYSFLALAPRVHARSTKCVSPCWQIRCEKKLLLYRALRTHRHNDLPRVNHALKITKPTY